MPKSLKSKAGARTVQVPAAVSQVVKSTRPVWAGVQDGIRIRHSELVGTLRYTNVNNFQVDTVAAASSGYDLNPSNGILFPWLSDIAKNFERYRFHNLCLEMFPAQATSTAGRCYGAVDLDWNDPVPTAAAQVMCNQYACEGPVWTNLSLTVAGKDLMRDMPYRYTTLISRATYVEPRTAMSGFFVFAANGPTACTWDLRVSYDVELINPTLETIDSVRGWNAALLAANYTAVTPVMGSVGANLATQVYDQLPGRDSPLKQVLSATGSTPELQSVYMGSTTGRHAWDTLGLLGRDAAVTIWQGLIVDGLSPSGIYATGSRPLLNLEAFDEVGVKLGNIDETTAPATVGTSGPSSWAVVGSPYVFHRVFSIAALRALWPTLRYIMATVFDGSGVGTFGAPGKRNGGSWVTSM